MDRPLSQQVSVITGASRGLGRAIAAHFAALGGDVVLLARGEDGLNETVEALAGADGQVLPLSCDVADRRQVEAVAERIIADLGRVDILVNNAGIAAPRGMAETRFEDWDEVIGTNLSGVFYMTRALWPALVASGRGYVINVAGTAGLRGGPSPAYGTAKAGLTGLTRSIAVNGKPHNIRATVLYPGGMDTGWRGSPIGKPLRESMAPAEVARYIGHLVTTPPEFVVNEAILNPINDPVQ